MGDCQNYGPFLGPYYDTGPNTGPNLGDPKRDHDFENPPYIGVTLGLYTDSQAQVAAALTCSTLGLSAAKPEVDLAHPAP